MKSLKIILYLLFLVSALNTQAQSKFSFGLTSSFLLNNRVITSSGPNVFIDYFDQKGRSKVGFDVSGLIRLRMSDRISIESGIGYSITGYHTEKKVISIYGQQNPAAPTYSYDFEYSNINLPIHLEYCTKGKISFNASFGPSVVFQTPKHFDAVFHDMSTSIDVPALGDLLLHEAKSINKKINISLDLGIGLGYRSTEKFEFVLQPKISYFLFSNETPGHSLYVDNLSGYNNQNETTKENFYSMGLSLKMFFTP